MKGKDLLLNFDRDKSRMVQYMGQVFSNIQSLENTKKKCDEKLKKLKPEFELLEKMSLEEFCEIHPDENYSGVFKGKKEGKALQIK